MGDQIDGAIEAIREMYEELRREVYGKPRNVVKELKAYKIYLKYRRQMKPLYERWEYGSRSGN